MMSTLEVDHANAGAHVLFAKGAPDVLLAHCTQVLLDSEAVALDETMRTRILADVDTMTGAALRTLGVARRTLAADAQIPNGDAGAAGLEQGLAYLGTVGIIDPPRAEAAVAIGQAHQAGIRVVMITGDHPRTAARIAADLGIVEAGAPVLTGMELDALDGAAFAHAAQRTSVFARVEPRHKLRIVRALQAAGNVVAMTGDGVNDAPALKAADIGIAMGVAGTEVTKEAARMVLADDNFATIVQAVREGRGVLDNIEKFLRYLLSSNIAEVLTVFLGVVGAGVIGLKATATGAGGSVVLPLLATQILWINLVTDTGPALAMGVAILFEHMTNYWPMLLDAKPRPISTIGAETPNLVGHFWVLFLDRGTQLLLPTILLTIVSVATYSRYTRSSMLEVSRQDYMRTARAKGLGERQVILKHAFRNSLIPITTIMAFDFAGLIGGAVITEQVFGWKGMGELFATGLRDVDPMPVMAFFLVTGTAAVLMNLVADVLYAVLDPRIRV